MAALPPDAIVRAGLRLIELLRHSSAGTTMLLLRTNSQFTDYTLTQYFDAFEWLVSLGAVAQNADAVGLHPSLVRLPSQQMRELLFERSLRISQPAWLLDADTLVPDEASLPLDARDLANDLGLTPTTAFLLVRSAHGLFDAEANKAIGTAGERALVELLEARWPGSTVHVASFDDGRGYDLALALGGTEWHLEVKTTTRRGRLVIYLSRHEYEVALLDPGWRLIVLGLLPSGEIGALATLDTQILARRAPADVDRTSRWQSVRHEIHPHNLRSGLNFIPSGALASEGADGLLLGRGASRQAEFAWVPTAT